MNALFFERKVKYGKSMVLTLLLSMVLSLTGCGSEEKDNVSMGMAAIEALEYEDALALFEQGLLAGENQRDIFRGQGIAYLGMTKYEEAIEAFEKCLQSSGSILDDMDFDVNYYLAAAFFKAGRYEEARGVYDNILALHAKDRDAYKLRGTVELEIGDFDSARVDYEQAISMDPENYDQLTAIYLELKSHGYDEVGGEYLQDALDNDAKDMSNYDKGRIYFFLGDFESARNYLEQARDAGDAQATYYLGMTWEALGEYNYAASVYNTYLQDQEESALIYNQLALCQMQLEDYDSALTAITQGLALDDESQNQTLLFNKIVILERQSKWKQAAKEMDSYMKNYPDDEIARREYIFLKSR